ncbi:LamG-like jellyroll fold domain-containing protein [Nonlabens xiamenensis]|uniref:LamG-like jellyroll fold domain-containing protein n=1 Tax=Nonlabens xiamenensis TaxID=2341043 RepID=UPI000F6074F0|nr:LamG-like jellyroll fold domain-containing protein [Nonlabens xiamenensis]
MNTNYLNQFISRSSKHSAGFFCQTLFLFFAFGLQAQTYCEPEARDEADLYINQVEFAGMINSGTGYALGYQDHTAHIGYVQENGTVTFQLTAIPLNAWQVGETVFGIFIDLNSDGDFTDTDETLVITPLGGESYAYTYTLPASMVSGNNYRVRFRAATSYLGDSCADERRSETEDYLIGVTSASGPSAIDDNFSATANSNGSDNTLDVSANDSFGPTHGSDGDDYSIASSPLTTANGGSVVETTDGVFEYTPGANFVGMDTFAYTFCDSGGNCASATVYLLVDFGACTPSSNSGGTHYITRFQLGGETTSIDNSSGDDGGYANFTGVTPADVYTGGTYTMDLDTQGDRSGWAAYIDYNRNGDFGDPGEQIYATNGEEATPYAPRSFTVPTGLSFGNRILRVGSRRYWSSNEPCGTTSGHPEEFEDYIVEVALDPSTPRTASVTGNLNTINDGDTTTSFTNFTDFGATDTSSGTRQRTFTITNIGGADLTLGTNPVIFAGGGIPEFTIIAAPASGTVIPSGGSESFTIEFNPSAATFFTTTVRVRSNSSPSGTNNYDFAISGEGAEIYPDTDGDDVSDNVDIDDDNDGITDTEEQNLCLANPLSSTADIIFLNETFGAGTNKVRIDDVTPGVSTTYCYEDGTTARAADECDNDQNLGDGKYAVHYSITDNDGNTVVGANTADISAWAERLWYDGQDHTVGDTDGRMAIFNASFEPGTFYETEIVGTVPGAPIYYEFWAINIDRADSEFDPSELPRILPNVTVNFLSLDKTITYHTFNAGDIPRCDGDPTNSCIQSDWINKNTTVVLPSSDFIIQLVNNAPGGFGNDLALDDIKITQQLCDLDLDGVADVVDLDNDNDGIPNIYEIGQPASVTSIDDNRDATSFNDSGWVDTNVNGMHDAYESFAALDSDGDGVADYLDLDSDNDGIFDVLEYDGYGDLDIRGDGCGDGTDLYTNSATDESDGDGILAMYDLNDNDSDNDDHGTAGFVLPQDSDGDGIPDYLDIDSNDAADDLTNGSDIDNSYYAHLDLDHDGRIDIGTDVDMDGVTDGTSDFDTGLFGAPIDLDTDLHMNFDGRNDYVQASISRLAGLSSFTAMAWVKLDASFSNTGTFLSDSGFELKITPSQTVQLVLTDNANNTYTLESLAALTINKWFNIAVIYDSNNNEVNLYINGVEEATAVTSGLPVQSIGGQVLTIGNLADGSNEYFHGSIDEVRLFSKAIEHQSMTQMMYQEVGLYAGDLKGKLINRTFQGVAWTDLILHYDFRKNVYDQVFDQSAAGIDAIMYNIKSIKSQSAPLPYETAQPGLLSDPSTYVEPVVWHPSDLAAYPYGILHVKHDVTLPVSAQSSGLIIDAGATLTILDGNEGNSKWYLLLNGTIDLLGDAQITQTEASELDVVSVGKILRRQEGKGDVYSYNYWASPVGELSTLNNNTDFHLGMLKDPFGNVQFTSRGVITPPVTQPATISGRWLYQFVSGNSYFDWLPIDQNTPLSPGTGWTQKGAGGSPNQQYIFEGKPNNGVIQIPVTTDAYSLVGNPYPSAIDARQFIVDNAGLIDGAVYLWDQFRGTDHVRANYEGGYATITQLATTRGSQIATGGALGGPTLGTVTPTFFLPVSQGFFVNHTGTGNLEFNNGQRVFKLEAAGESIFTGAPGSSQAQVDRSDYQDQEATIIRLELESEVGESKEIVLGFDQRFTMGEDYGFDGRMYDNPRSWDLYTQFGGRNYVINALPEIQPNAQVPLIIHAEQQYQYILRATEIAQIDAGQIVLLHDKDLNVYHDLRQGDYLFQVPTDGRFENRFEVVFEQPSTLSNDDYIVDGLQIYYASQQELLFVDHVEGTLEKVQLYDLSGKLLYRFRESDIQNSSNGMRLPTISSGIYLVEVHVDGQSTTQKIIKP